MFGFFIKITQQNHSDIAFPSHLTNLNNFVAKIKILKRVTFLVNAHGKKNKSLAHLLFGKTSSELTVPNSKLCSHFGISGLDVKLQKD